MRIQVTMTTAGRAVTTGTVFLALALTMGVWGCPSGGQNNAAQNTPPAATPTPAPPDQAMNQPRPDANADVTPGEPAETIPAKTTPKPTPPKPTPKPPAPTPAPVKEPVVLTIPAGTMLKASLNQEMRSDKATVGDTFTMSVAEPVLVNGTVVIPAGSTIQGEVVQAKASGKVSGQGELRLAFKSVVDATGTSRPIAAETFYAEAESGTDTDVARVAGGAAAGAIIGGLLGGKQGAGVGGLIGAAAGTGTVLATAGPQVKLAVGQMFEVKLIEPLDITAG